MNKYLEKIASLSNEDKDLVRKNPSKLMNGVIGMYAGGALGKGIASATAHSNNGFLRSVGRNAGRNGTLGGLATGVTMAMLKKDKILRNRPNLERHINNAPNVRASGAIGFLTGGNVGRLFFGKTGGIAGAAIGTTAGVLSSRRDLDKYLNKV